MRIYTHEKSPELTNFIEESIVAATELGYSKETISKLKRAKSESECQRIMATERERTSNLEIDLLCYKNRRNQS